MTGDISTITIGADGWYADITVNGLDVGGTYDFGLAVNNNPFTGTPKIKFNITSPGYDDTGSTTTVSRTIYGTRQVQKAYPQDAQANETASGGNVTVRIALSDLIFSADTIDSVNILSGFYTQNSIPNNAITINSVSNGSTVGYDKAICLLRWASTPFRRMTSTVDVEVVAYQTFGRNNRPVRCVKFVVTDGTNTSTQYVTTMTQATTPSGMPCFSVYKCTMSTSPFTQGAKLTVQAIAYPWVGDSNAIRDTGTTTTTGSASLHAQAHLCDKSGTYLAPYVYVDTSKNITVSGSISGTLTDREVITQTGTGATAIVIGTPSGSGPVKVCNVTGTPDSSQVWTGNTSGFTFTPSSTPTANGSTTGVVSTTAATAAATPYSNFWNAVKGIRDYINTNASRANSLDGAVIRLKAGDVPFGRDGTASNMSAPNAAVIIERDPTVGISDVRLRGKATSTQNILCSNIYIRNLTIWPSTSDQSNFLSCSGLTDECLILENCIIRQDTNATTSVYVNSGVEEKWMKDNTHINNGVQLSGSITRSSQLSNHNAAGFTMSGLVIGNTWLNDSTNTASKTFATRSTGAATNVIIAYNKFTSAGAPFLNGSFDFIDYAIVSNLVERITDGTQPALGTNTANFTNVMLWHNTWTDSSRINLENNSNTSVKFTNLNMRYNSWYYWASKHDVFNSNSGLTGGWPTHYGVGCLGNNNTRLVSYPIFGGLCYTTVQPEGFTTDNSRSYNNTGNGNYIPRIGSPLCKRVIAGDAPLDIDIAGVAIPNDGTGDAGAYQQTSNDEPVLQSGFFFA